MLKMCKKKVKAIKSQQHRSDDDEVEEVAADTDVQPVADEGE